MNAALLVAVMALVTMLLRFLPFFVLHKETPPAIAYLGKVLPPAIIGMLVVYCLKDTSVFHFPFGIPELIAVAGTVGIHVWKRNSILSILAGTILYMMLLSVMS